jgi:hypothetical protein
MVAVRLTKAWVPVDEILNRLKGNLGVFQLADAQQHIIFIGFAGGKSQYGLKGEVSATLANIPDCRFVRCEVTTAYHTRYRELLMAHVADHGALPIHNPPIKLGRLSPV